MNKLETFQQFLATQSTQIPVLALIINLLLTALLSYAIGIVYIRYGTALSNRKLFARNFMLIAMTTMLIITIVKSSLALSLGLVGALSIVRFRAAIKEPEELSYLFLNIAVGLGFGADQRLATIVAFIMIYAVIKLRAGRQKKENNQNLYVTVTSKQPHKITLEQILAVLGRHCSAVDMKRFDETQETIEASFLIEIDTIGQLHTVTSSLRQLNESVKITYVDNSGIMS